MSNIDDKNDSLISEVARKVPAEIAGPVLIIIVFLLVSPSILEKLQNGTPINIFLLIMGIVLILQASTIFYITISNYQDKNRKSKYQPERFSKYSTIIETKSGVTEQIEQAVSNMEGNRQDE